MTAKTPLFLTLELIALEDLHIGSGTGGGDIDAQVIRDRLGRPIIPATHLKGLLREAGEELQFFGQATGQELQTLLGVQGTAKAALRLTSLRVTKGGETLVWGSSARNQGGRSPKEDTLRFIEHVAAGTVFTAKLRLADLSLKPLLDRLLRRIDRIGGDRNRGSGLVKLNWNVGGPKSETETAKVTGPVIGLVLRNLEPLCLAVTGHPGNLIRTGSFIRGQTLRGALIAWAIHSGRTSAVPALSAPSYGDALPLPKGLAKAKAVLPIPLSILTEKPKGGVANLPWWAGGSPDPVAFDSLGPDREPNGEKPKRPGEHEYLCHDGKTWFRYSPELAVRLRNATPKRDSQDDAELFSLEQVAEETRFQTELRFADAEEAKTFAETLAPLLNEGDWLVIGRGGAPVVVELLEAIPQSGRDAAALKPSFSTQAYTAGDFGDDWTLTLTSDGIVRGVHLGFLDDFDIDTLCRLAGFEKPQPCNWKIAKRTVETERIHGYNAATGLKRSPALALRRGSCWRITGSDSAALAQALRSKQALGERIEEGFGRFLLNLQPLAAPEKPNLVGETPARRINEALLKQAKVLAGKISKGGPSLSQLQWLRGQALAIENSQQLEDLLAEIETAPQRRPQGGKAWENFHIKDLREELAKLDQNHPNDSEQALKDKQMLISYLVQWHAPKAKEQRQ